ncbi:lipocalin family protein [Croceiramulus getboli]|nr:hypothetical protein P8624_11460 [Flavobacteriaceae bacterium YJPT1-3]
MRTLIAFLLVLSTLSCGQPTLDDSQLLQGYWEIETVRFPDGTEKEYSLNTTIDFIELDGQQGSRSKVQPQLDGSYQSTPTVEQFTLAEMDSGLQLQYRTPYDSWEETVIHLSEDQLVIVNKDGVEYTYKRYVPLSL